MSFKVMTARLGPTFSAAMLLVIVMGWPLAARAGSGLERAVAATLIVLGEDQRPLGSAVLLEGGVVITVADTVGGRSAVDLRDSQGRMTRARVVARDGRRGIVVMQVRADFGPGLTLAPENPGVGTPVFAVGAPLGLEVMLTRGIIAAGMAQPDASVPIHALKHDALLNVGVAGGPLVDAEGRLLGLNRAAPEGALAGLGWAISAEDLARIVPLMLTGQWREVPDLGLSLRRVTADIADALGLAEAGLLVESVIARSRADRAGLRPGDVVLGFGDTVLDSVGKLAFLIDSRGEDSARLHLRRGEALLTVTLDLAPVTRQLNTLAVSSVAVGRIQSYTFATLGVVFEDEARVSHVSFHSPAFIGGLQAGDVVLALNGIPVSRAKLDGLKITKPILLLVSRGGATLHVLVDPWVSAPKDALQQRANLLDARSHLF